MEPRCPFCGGALQIPEEQREGVLPCASCHAEVDVALARLLIDSEAGSPGGETFAWNPPQAQVPSRPEGGPSTEEYLRNAAAGAPPEAAAEPGTRTADLSEPLLPPPAPVPAAETSAQEALPPPDFVGSYVLRSTDAPHLKEVVYSGQAPRVGAQPPAGADKAAPPADASQRPQPGRKPPEARPVDRPPPPRSPDRPVPPPLPPPRVPDRRDDDLSLPMDPMHEDLETSGFGGPDRGGAPTPRPPNPPSDAFELPPLSFDDAFEASPAEAPTTGTPPATRPADVPWDAAPVGPESPQTGTTAYDDPFAALNLSFDDLVGGPTSPAPRGGDAARGAGVPPGPLSPSGGASATAALGSLDLDAVLAEDSGVDALPWTSQPVPEPGPSPRPLSEAGARPGALNLDLDLSANAWNQPAPEGGAAPPPGFELPQIPQTSMQIPELAIGPTPQLAVEPPQPAIAAPPPTAMKTRRPASKSGGMVALIAVFLVLAVGAILGQTKYGYFGLNLLGGGTIAQRGAPVLLPGTGPGAGSVPGGGIARDTRESYQEEIARLERALSSDAKDAQARQDLLEVLIRYKERYPAVFAADAKLDARVKQLQSQVTFAGKKADLIHAMDLLAAGNPDAARALLERMASTGDGGPEVLYFLGKAALAQKKPEDAEKYLESSLEKDPANLATRYFLALAALERKDTAKARTTLDEVLAKEPGHLASRAALARIAAAGQDWDGARRLAGEVIAKAGGTADADEVFEAHRILATVGEVQGKSDERLAELRAALAVRPADEETAVKVAETLAAAGKKDESMAVLEPCRQKPCTGEAFLVAYAQAAFRLGRTEAAEAVVKEGLQKYPKSGAFALIKGRAFLEAGRIHAATAAFEDALKADPDSVDTIVLLATALTKEGKLSEAAERLRAGAENASDPVVLWVALAGVQREKRDFSGAEESLKKASAADSGNPKVQQALGLVVLAQGRAAEAVAILSQLENKKMLDREGALGLATAWMQAREPAKARDLLARLYATAGDDTELAAAYAHALFEANSTERAKEVLAKLLADHPSNAVAHFYLGRIAEKAGDKAKAVEELMHAVQLDSDSTLYRLELAKAQLAQGTPDSVHEARTQLDTIITAYGRGEVPVQDRDAEAYVLRGQMLFKEQKYPLAMKDLEAALTLAPARLDVLVGSGRTLFEMARYTEAAPYFKQALSREGANAEANYYLGLILLRSGHIEDAKVHLERSVARDPKVYPDAHRQLGLIYRDQGLKPLARKAFQTYLEYAPKNTAEAEEIKGLLERMR